MLQDKNLKVPTYAFAETYFANINLGDRVDINPMIAQV